jgi:tRNA-splicing ligase RtcB
MAAEEIRLNRLEECLWEIPRQGGMRVPGRIYASEKLMADLKQDNSLRQVMNVAHLPGIVGYSLAMPDIHWGYGFPIGGVAALSIDEGVVSPGGVGYDIN